MIEVNAWGHKPTPRFSWTKKENENAHVFFGVELETELLPPAREKLESWWRGVRQRTTTVNQDTPSEVWLWNRGEPNTYHGRTQWSYAAIQDVEPMIRKLQLYVKQDASLEDGVELVSHPWTLNFWHESYPLWKKLCKDLQTAGFTSYKGNTCGMHVHISKSAFWGDLHQLRFQAFVHRNPAFFLAYSNRTDLKKVLRFAWFHKDPKAFVRRACTTYLLPYETDPARYAFTHGINPALLAGTHDDHHSVVNSTAHTVEIRVFRGTLNPDSIMANVELVEAVRRYTAAISFQQMSIPGFVEWLLKHKKELPYAAAKTQKCINKAANIKSPKISKITVGNAALKPSSLEGKIAERNSRVGAIGPLTSTAVVNFQHTTPDGEAIPMAYFILQGPCWNERQALSMCREAMLAAKYHEVESSAIFISGNPRLTLNHLNPAHHWFDHQSDLESSPASVTFYIRDSETNEMVGRATLTAGRDAGEPNRQPMLRWSCYYMGLDLERIEISDVEIWTAQHGTRVVFPVEQLQKYHKATLSWLDVKLLTDTKRNKSPLIRNIKVIHRPLTKGYRSVA